MKHAYPWMPVLLLFLLVCRVFSEEEQSVKDALQKELESEIMAPCCYGGPVADHDSEAARQVKTQIAGLLAEGKTKEEILDMYVAIYGEQILARPRARGFNLLAYIMPPVILLVGGLMFVYFVGRFKTPATDTVDVKTSSYGDEFLRKVEEEMKELDI